MSKAPTKATGKPAGVKKGTQVSHGKKKKAVKPPLSVEERQKRYFGSLCDQIEGDHLDNALRTTNKLLVIDPEDQDALQAKLFLLLRTNRYQEALHITEEKTGMFIFERAYALYRLQREDEAYELVRDEGVDRAVMFLQAQINYRQGDYASALEKYNTLLSTSSPALEEYQDIQTNINATETNLQFLQTGFLTSIHQLPHLPRGQTLEDMPLPPLNPPTHHTTTAEDTNTLNEKADEQPKTKAPRKSRIPKGVVPGVTPAPDPERWIKKSERTKVESHGRKKKGGGGATQGSTAPQEQPKSSGGGGGKKKKK